MVQTYFGGRDEHERPEQTTVTNEEQPKEGNLGQGEGEEGERGIPIAIMTCFAQYSAQYALSL